MSQAKFDELRGRLAEIADLGKAAALLGWDQHVMMPPGGAALRAEQLATIGRIAHQKFTSPEMGTLIDSLRGFGEQHDYDSFEASLIRVVARDWEKSSKVPSELRAEMSRSAALANPVWVDARKRNDFAAFLPVLRKNLDLRKRYIDCFEVDDEPYDIVLDDYERGMKTKEVRALFDYLKEHQAPLVKEVAASGGNEPHEHNFAIEPQKVFELEVARAFGFTDDAWRLDPTVHPFASGTGVTDIRITTRYFTRAPRRPLRDDARVRARPLRAPGRPGARALAARARRLARHARVAEPHVGEPRRPLAAVLAALLPARSRSCSPTSCAPTTTSAGTGRSTPSSRR